MSVSAPAGAFSGGGLTGTEFGQRLSMQEQENFHLSPDTYDRKANSQYLEVYMHYAAIERQREAEDPRPIPDASWTIMFKTLTGQKSKIVWGNEERNPVVTEQERRDSQIEQQHTDSGTASETEKEKETVAQPHHEPVEVSQADRERLYSALRVASWQAVFYLITTDILGFSSASKTFQDMGYGGGVLTYFFFYILAVFSGQVIWKLYLSLDSVKFPVVCYADLGERLFGRFVRHLFNVLQSGQLLFNVAVLINGNGQVLAELANWKAGTCFMLMCFVFFAVGAIGGQIQSLRNFAWFANCNIWLNLATMIMTIYGCAKYPPIPQLSYHSHLGPIDVSGWVPKYTVGWYQQVSGVQLAVFAYGGAMIFPEFMAEMRRPKDFWKSLLFAQFFCFACYMLFGLIIYSYQGKYSAFLSSLNFTNRGLILANNIIGILTIQIAAILYSNIGVKVFYENVLRAYFKAPSMLTGRGRIIHSVTVITYWALAWMIGVAIPYLAALVTLIGALFILQFTYTFPPIMCLGYWMQIDALKGDRPWEPGMIPGSNRVDTWKDKSRWRRGFKSYWYAKAFLALMFLAAIVNSVLGIYAGIRVAIVEYDKTGYGGAFSCIGPGYPHPPGKPNDILS